MEESKRKKIEEESQSLRIIAKLVNKYLEELLGYKMGFALLVFEFGNPCIGNYISNAERESMIKALRETANRLNFVKISPKRLALLSKRSKPLK